MNYTTIASKLKVKLAEIFSNTETMGFDDWLSEYIDAYDLDALTAEFEISGDVIYVPNDPNDETQPVIPDPTDEIKPVILESKKNDLSFPYIDNSTLNATAMANGISIWWMKQTKKGEPVFSDAIFELTNDADKIKSEIENIIKTLGTIPDNDVVYDDFQKVFKLIQDEVKKIEWTVKETFLNGHIVYTITPI